MVAYSDRTRFPGLFRLGGYSTGTRKSSTGRSMSALAIHHQPNTTPENAVRSQFPRNFREGRRMGSPR
jgi:hypothetical protein